MSKPSAGKMEKKESDQTKLGRLKKEKALLEYAVALLKKRLKRASQEQERMMVKSLKSTIGKK